MTLLRSTRTQGIPPMLIAGCVWRVGGVVTSDTDSQIDGRKNSLLLNRIWKNAGKLQHTDGAKSASNGRKKADGGKKMQKGVLCLEFTARSQCFL